VEVGVLHGHLEDLDLAAMLRGSQRRGTVEQLTTRHLLDPSHHIHVTTLA
jgi:hypothetical protein